MQYHLFAPFLFMLASMLALNGCKKAQYLGTYNGTLYTCVAVEVSPGVFMPSTEPNPATIEVEASSGNNVIIGYGSGIKVELSSTGNFDNHDGFTGSFRNDTLKFYDHVSAGCSESFIGGKQ